MTLVFGLVLVAGVLTHPQLTSADGTGACVAPSTDYGTVSGLSVTTTGTTTNIWSRMAIPDTTNNSYLLEVDNSSDVALDCYTVTAGSGAVYASGATTYFNNNTTNWVDKTVSLPAGTYHLKLIGNAPNVVIDRLLLTQDSSCSPTGTGDNCTTVTDTIPPTVSITSPANNASGTSPVTVTNSASDNSGTVAKVELFVDGASTAAQTSTTSPFSFTVTGLSVGSHTFMTEAFDPSNNSAFSQLVTVTVPDTTKPTVAMSAPATNTTQTGNIAVSATASDNVGVAKVEFFADSSTTPFSTVTSGSSGTYSTQLNTTTLSNGSHTIKAEAFDAAGNNATSSTVTITASNSSSSGTPPVVAITAPLAAAVLSNDLSNTHFNSSAYVASATATSANNIKQVVFKLDGTTVATDTAAPYNATLNLTTLSCGPHTLTATATDSSTSALSTTSPTITFDTTYAEDINNDCHVTYLDLSALAAKYNQTGTLTTLGRADINQDGTVNYLDLSALAAQYNKH
jgi:hypothetical protein